MSPTISLQPTRGPDRASLTPWETTTWHPNLFAARTVRSYVCEVLQTGLCKKLWPHVGTSRTSICTPKQTLSFSWLAASILAVSVGLAQAVIASSFSFTNKTSSDRKHVDHFSCGLLIFAHTSNLVSQCETISFYSHLMYYMRIVQVPSLSRRWLSNVFCALQSIDGIHFVLCLTQCALTKASVCEAMVFILPLTRNVDA